MAINVSAIHLSFCDKIALNYIRLVKRIHIADMDSHKHYCNLYRKSLIKSISTEEGRPRPTEFYEISEIGIDYINYRSEHRFDSVLCPIIVSILTNIGINALQWLLQRL